MTETPRTPRPVIYLAHPVAPTDAEVAEAAAMVRALEYDFQLGELRQLARRANVVRAQGILMALRREFPDVVFTAPWIACLLHEGEDDDDPVQREAGLADNEELVLRCDGIALTGARLSGGMRREERAGACRSGSIGSTGLIGSTGSPGSFGSFVAYDLVGIVTIATDVPTANRSAMRWPTGVGPDDGGVLVGFDAWAGEAGRATRYRWMTS